MRVTVGVDLDAPTGASSDSGAGTTGDDLADGGSVDLDDQLPPAGDVGDDGDAPPSPETSSVATTAPVTTVPAPTGAATNDPSGTTTPATDDDRGRNRGNPGDGTQLPPAYDPSLTAPGTDCDKWSLGDDEWVDVLSGHYVVDGQLGAACYGAVDQRLLDAWGNLVAITPPDQLGDLGLFVGFVDTPEADGDLLAWTHSLDSDGASFQMAINLEEGEADPNELLLTLAHEFSHIFASASTQMDRTVEAYESCATYYVGDGCLYEDSLIWDWIQTFWTDGLLDGVDPESSPLPEDGVERCRNNPGFFGDYAASNPEEDFAEAFSAYVFDLPTNSPEQQERLDWIGARPGLAEFRSRAEAAGLTPLANTFNRCGR